MAGAGDQALSANSDWAAVTPLSQLHHTAVIAPGYCESGSSHVNLPKPSSGLYPQNQKRVSQHVYKHGQGDRNDSIALAVFSLLPPYTVA